MQLAEQEAEQRRREEEASAALIEELCSLQAQETEEDRRQREAITEHDARLAEELGRLINEVGKNILRFSFLV
jgi:hypothetical protein